MQLTQALESLHAFIRERDGFTVIAHTSPDGDALGSSLALVWLLRRMGKEAEAVCTDPVPALYSFLPLSQDVRLPKDAVGYKNVIAVDCADIERLGEAKAIFERAASTYNIDHHPSNNAYAHHNIINPESAATGELIYGLAKRAGIALEPDFADCVYTAIITDTGNFSYSNTTGETLRIAGDLLDAGADGYGINLRMFRSASFSKTRLLGKAIANIRLYEDGAIGATSLTRREMEDCGAQEEDTEGTVDHVRDIEGVEIALFIKEAEPNVWKVSLRSKLRADVGAIASNMSGGGHSRAAGYTAYGSLDSVWAAALIKAREALL